MHLQNCLTIGTLEALLCQRHELNKDFLHDLHHGQINDEIMYIRKMSLTSSYGGLWGDFIAIYWISQYLQQPIYV